MNNHYSNNKSFISIPTGREVGRGILEGIIKKSTVRWNNQNGLHLDSPLFFPYYLDDPICKSSDIKDLNHSYYDFSWCIFQDSHSSNYFLLFEDGNPKSIVYLDKYFGIKIIAFEDLILIVCKKGHVVSINLSTLIPIFIGPISSVEPYNDWVWNLGEIKIDGEYQLFTSGEFKNNSLFIREYSTGKTVEYFLDIRDYEIDFIEQPDRTFSFDNYTWESLKENKKSRIF